MKMSSTHESVASYSAVKVASERSFGLVFAGFFAIVGVWPWLMGGELRLWAIGLAAAFLLVAFAAPRLLAPLNRLWARLGRFLHHIVNPVIMAFIYFGALVPTALVLKAKRKDLLRLTRDKSARSYWIVREPPGPARGSMSKQF
jgi:hypothetical protein